MENTDECEDRPAGPRPSSYHEFADVFSFFQHFKSELSLPDVLLDILEDFFIKGDVSDPKDTITTIHFTLVKKGVRRAAVQDNWTTIAVKYAYSKGVVGVASDYDDLTLYERVKLLWLLCDAQFERNNDFKNNIVKYPDNAWRDKPIGLDRQGCRYWLLQDSSYDIRLYSEDRYTEHPYGLPIWSLLCSSAEGLVKLIDKLKSSPSTDTSNEDEDENSSEREEQVNGRSQKRTGRGKNEKKKKVSDRGRVLGCMQCLKDTNHTKMLLCDGCDAECHMYCQYPVVWSIPEDDWFCPNCRQSQLVSVLERTHCSMLAAREARLRDQELQERRMRSLARGGMLLQNIIMNSDADRRPSRERKVVNYAELNDPYIPQLSRRDLIYHQPSSQSRSMRTRQACLEEVEQQQEYGEEEEEEEEKNKTVASCKLLVTTEYKGDTANWREATSLPADLCQKVEEEEEEEEEKEEEKERKFVCRIPFLKSVNLLYQQTSLKPHASCEGQPSLELPAHEALLPPPLPPSSPPTSTQGDWPLAVAQTTSPSTCPVVGTSKHTFTSCPTGSLYHRLEASSSMEVNNSNLLEPPQQNLHHMTALEDKGEPVNRPSEQQ